MGKKITSVLFVGLGGIGQRHLRNFRKIMGNTVEVFAYRKRNAQFVLSDQLEIIEGEELNKKYDIKCVDTLEDGLRRDIDAVFICNPTSMHVEVLEKALQAGCNVFVEKPIADTLDSLKGIEDGGYLSDKVVFVGYQNRYHPCIIKLKQLIEVNAIGMIVSVFAEIGESVKNWHKYENYKNLYACKKELGGGVVVTQTHELDYLYYLFGMPKSVYALGGKLSNLDMDVEDVADILMKYEIDSKTIPIVVHEDYLQVPMRRGCRIIGTKGKIEVDLAKATICVYDDAGNISYNEKFNFNRNDMFLAEMKQFLVCIEQTLPSPIPLEEGKKSLEIAMAIKESMQTGMPIKVY